MIGLCFLAALFQKPLFPEVELYSLFFLLKFLLLWKTTGSATVFTLFEDCFMFEMTQKTILTCPKTFLSQVLLNCVVTSGLAGYVD